MADVMDLPTADTTFCIGVALGQVQRERVIHVMNSMLEELIGELLAAIQAGKRARIQ